jgi:hypothetical protein
MPSKTKNKKLRQWFKIQKWKWYVVDNSDWHKPILVRKHLDTKEQATMFRDKYYLGFDVVYYKEALDFGLNDGFHTQRHIQHAAKYEYPDTHTTQQQKHIFRNTQRAKMKTEKNTPKLSETAMWEIIDDKPIFFIMKRMKQYRMNQFPYSEPVEGIATFKELREWPSQIVRLSNIVRCLKDHYDIGYYNMVDVALAIDSKWGEDIQKHADGVRAIPLFDHERISNEFLARGFVERSTLSYDEEEDSWIESIHLNPILAHPELCWHRGEDRDLYDHYIYAFQGYVGIPGYTRAIVAGLKKRK